LKERESITGPSLVICPLSVLYSWCNELERWAPSLSFLRLHSSSADEREAQRNAFIEKATEYDVVITTYEMAKSPRLRSLWQRQYFNLLVLDEGHRIKDASSQIAKAVRSIHRENSLILTGTPLQNNLIELWSLLNFLYPDVFSSQEPFASAFNLTENVIDKECLQKAPAMLRCFMLRRLKDEVEKLMPKKIETKVWQYCVRCCPISCGSILTQIIGHLSPVKRAGILVQGTVAQGH
jgi:SWI/SNF-related matrix-associated actin-dependent regulator of chromatin subfamily A member 5